jgi:hypothetical protein
MDIDKLKQLLAEVQAGQVGVEQALDRLRVLPYDDIGHTRLDLHRSLRQGLPEVVFCQNKTVEQVLSIMEKLWQYHDRVLATRVSAEMAIAVQARLAKAHYDPTARLLTLPSMSLTFWW